MNEFLSEGKMQKTEKKVTRFPRHSPFSAYSSLKSFCLVDGPSWTLNPKASPGMLGVHFVCRKPLATVWAVVSQRSEPEDVGAVFCCWLYTLEGNACPEFCRKTHWEVAAETQWQMAKFRAGGEQARQEVITLFSVSVVICPLHSQER